MKISHYIQIGVHLDDQLGIKTGLANGATLEQMMANPELAHKAYLDAQLRALDKAKETISLKRIGGIVAG